MEPTARPRVAPVSVAPRKENPLGSNAEPAAAPTAERASVAMDGVL